MRRLAVSLGLFALGIAAVLLLRDPQAAGPAVRFETPGAGSGASGYAAFETEVMATTVRATVPSDPAEPSVARAHADAVFEAFRHVDEEMNEWKEGSPLTAVNRNAGGEPVPVPEDLFALLQRGVEIGELTDGAFDVTWAALWGLWDFRAAEPRVPSAEEIAERVALVDYREVELHAGPEGTAPTVRLPEEGMAIGLGGIAKGYALERAGGALRARGVESFLLVAGGQVLAGGGKREGDDAGPWRVGIRDPRGEPDDLFAVLALRGGSLSTSGDYERYFVLDGTRYHHVLDPRTGRPARGVRSATVVCADPVLADALSTALMVLGVEKSLALVGGLDGVEAALVDDRGALHVTPGLRGRLQRAADTPTAGP
jgi:thiamine biosynthesis lipoprotein